jgi:hypothetical protein
MKGSFQFLALFTILTLISSAAWAQLGPAPANTPQPPWAFADAAGDGICDITGQPVGSGRSTGQGQGKGKKYGPGDGTGNQGTGPGDGTGYGAGKGKGNGSCDGTGPRGGGSGGSRGGRGGRR